MTDCVGSAYEDRVVVVTGSSRGVGFSIANHFLAHGAQVIGLSTASCSIESNNYTHYAVRIDESDQVLAVFRGIRKRFGAVDILINNAAVLTSQHAMIMPVSSAQDMINVNFMGAFLVAKECAKLMKKKKWGRIVNISSMAVSLEPVGDSVYAGCKAALTTISNVMAKELSAINVTCNTLGISAIKSDMLAQLPEEKIDAVIASLPIPRYANFEDISNVIDFFVSEKSSYVTAQTIYLGGVS